MLFKSTTQIVPYAEITASTNFATVKPSIQRIERQQLVPIIGLELYNDLNTAFSLAETEEALSAAYQELLIQCREVIGSYLGYYFAPMGELKFSDAGLRRSETASEKTAFQYQVTNFREACLKNGDAASENLLEFLEENKDNYDLWVNSKAFTRYRSLFIKTGKEFEEFFPSHSPYRNYWAMRSKMVDVEEINMRKSLGSDLFDYLKEKDRSETPSFTQKEKDLLFKLKKAVANFTVSFSIPFLAVRMDANGITVATTGARTNRDEDAQRQYAPDKSISGIISSAKESGEQWLKDIIEFLNKNAADFELWEVQEQGSGDIYDVNNDLNGSFGI